MKKALSAALVLLLLTGVLTACSNVDYGEAFTSQQELKQNLEQNGVSLKYPQFFSNQEQENVKYHYISNRSVKEKTIVGYKIYSFGEVFSTAVYGYHFSTEEIQSEDTKRLRQMESVFLENTEIKLYEGTAHKESLFLIAAANIDGKHYECRIVGNDVTQKGEFINYIYQGNHQYTQAMASIKRVFEQLK